MSAVPTPPPNGSLRPTCPPAIEPSTNASLPLWCLVALPVNWFLNLQLLLAHNPLTRAITLGTDLAKEQALKAIPQEWMGGLAQPVIQLINQYVGPYALAGEAFMGTWAILLTLILPASFLLLGFAIVHSVLLLGGAPGGWKGTVRAFLINHACADLATLAWAGLIFVLKLSLFSKCGLLLAGLLLIRLIAHAWLLVSLSRTHSLGALRIIFLGLPSLLFAFAVSSLVTTALWTWLTAGFALTALSQAYDDIENDCFPHPGSGLGIPMWSAGGHGSTFIGRREAPLHAEFCPD